MRYCPYCGGDIASHLAVDKGNSTALAPSLEPVTSGKYDQDVAWRAIIAAVDEARAAPPSTSTLVDNAVLGLGLPPEAKAFSTIVHLAFDREIVPRGGVLYKATLLEGRTPMDTSKRSAMGYAVKDEKVVLVNDIPVGKAYGVLQYWGGESQHKRWHLAEPIVVEASRNGTPFFMDTNMIAFGAKWRDAAELSAALLRLCELFITGVKDSGSIAQPLGLYLHLQA